MELMQIIKERKSIRKFSGHPVEQEKIEKVIEAARLAPSARNNQAWKFIVVRDEKKREQLMEAANGQPSVKSAPVVLVACGLNTGVMTNNHRADSIDLSIAMSFAILEAYEQGLGTCWLANYDEGKVRAALGIPESASVVMITPLGYPDETPQPKPRKTLDEVICFDGYKE